MFTLIRLMDVDEMYWYIYNKSEQKNMVQLGERVDEKKSASSWVEGKVDGSSCSSTATRFSLLFM